MKTSQIFQAITVVTAIILVGCAGLLSLQLRASNRLLSSIRGISPGLDIEEVKKRIGKEAYRIIKEKEEILEYGTIKDARFCDGKILYWFYVSTPPCRVVEVYTDTGGKVSFVTWQGL